MPGPAPKAPQSRRRTNVPALGEWQAVPGVGWQHGPIPTPPRGLLKASREAWAAWFGAWFAAHWGPEDLPVLQQLVRLFDLVERGNASATVRSELRTWADGYGITPKGQQMRRWVAPQAAGEAGAAAPASDEASRYRHLRSLDGGESA
jgi:hypothetical protein